MKKETVYKIFSNIPTLHTARLSLRPMHPINAEDMFAQYYSKMDSSLDDTNINCPQYTVKNQIAGINDNGVGTPARTRNAIDLYLGLDFEDASFYSRSYNERVFRKDVLKSILNDEEVVICSTVSCQKVKPFMPIINEAIGHYMFIYGYVTIDLQNYYLIADPLPMPNGNIHIVTYEDVFLYKAFGEDNYKMWADALTANDSKYQWENYNDIQDSIFS